MDCDDEPDVGGTGRVVEENDPRSGARVDEVVPGESGGKEGNGLISASGTAVTRQINRIGGEESTYEGRRQDLFLLEAPLLHPPPSILRTVASAPSVTNQHAV